MSELEIHKEYKETISELLGAYIKLAEILLKEIKRSG